jgi:hypothetical protein
MVQTKVIPAGGTAAGSPRLLFSGSLHGVVVRTPGGRGDPAAGPLGTDTVATGGVPDPWFAEAAPGEGDD